MAVTLNVPYDPIIQPKIQSLSDSVGKWTDINNAQAQGKIAQQQEQRAQQQFEREQQQYQRVNNSIDMSGN